ncbi:MAG TPA: sugar phosphate nucleotidyltransferase [Candidatus Sulfotelmatobacter sp.]|nr:sugar phosphate nucleotidyltransferase [Candidatus Sulfotelmatobacter sp.]
MKVVLFCGGLGLRLRERSEALPKPMVPIGYRPILWHVMRYYAHFGHHDFILCLGYGATAIKEYFLRYDEAVSNDFVLSQGGEQIELLGTDIQDWRITFVDTGLNVTIGERLRAVRSYVQDEAIFLANYGDTLTDAPLDRAIADFAPTDATASFLSVRPTGYGFNAVTIDPDGHVTAFQDPMRADIWINGGYFILRPDVFAAMQPGEELVEAPFARLAATGHLATVRYDGFWAPVDTLRDVQRLEEMAEMGTAPWMLWARETRPAAVTRRAGTGGAGRAALRRR